jgi:hypothetical protein
MLVALISAYLEGALARGAIRSALEATDQVIVFEGPAGEPLEGDLPETDYAEFTGRITLVRGAWKTDAAKRTAMVEHCRRWRNFAPVWGVWVDGDEVLLNGQYLQDELNLLEWEDDPAEPFMGWPMKLVELDGGVTVCRGKVVRVDLIDSYSVSSSVFRNVMGNLHGEGNIPLRASEHWAPLRHWLESLPAAERAVAEDRIFLRPPLPCEPFLMHRSALRHPARRGLRMHAQEASELAKAKRELSVPE